MNVTLGILIPCFQKVDKDFYMQSLLRYLVMLTVIMSCSVSALTTSLGSDGLQGFSQAQANIETTRYGRCAIDDSVFIPANSDVILPAFTSLSNVEVRKWYVSHLTKIPKLINKKCTLEEQAHQAWSLRNTFRTAARYAMNNQDLATVLNKQSPNMTWAETMKKYSGENRGDELWAAIIESAQRSNEKVNRSLGMSVR